MKYSGFLLLVFVATCFFLNHGAVIQEEIYNGFNAKPGQFPFQALLQIWKNEKSSSFCGGALICRNYILTAAHCTYNALRAVVYLGITYTQQNNDGAVYIDVNNSNFIIHPMYDPKTFRYDISAVKLPYMVELTSYIQLISLPDNGNNWKIPSNVDNLNATASGWGKTTDNQTAVQSILQYATVHIMPHADCSKAYINVNNITNGMICTDKHVVYAGPCPGDSGGPLTISVNSTPTLVGLVSWGASKCSSSSPVVYVFIPTFLSWINPVTNYCQEYELFNV